MARGDSQAARTPSREQRSSCGHFCEAVVRLYWVLLCTRKKVHYVGTFPTFPVSIVARIGGLDKGIAVSPGYMFVVYRDC